MPSFTNNVIDQAYEKFMKQIPGFHQEPPEAKEIQQDLERRQRRKGECNDSKTYQDHAATIRRWVAEDRRKGKSIPNYTYEEGESL